MTHLSLVAGWCAKALTVVLAIVALNFLLLRLAPGDPATVLAGEAGASDAQFLAQIRRDYGLDRPLPEQLAAYVGNVLRLNLGHSYRQRRDVAGIIFERVPATLLLTGSAFVLALLGGVSLGVLAATRVGRWTDSLITVLALGFYAMPLFWIGLLFILLFSVQLGLLPAFGMYSVGAGHTGFAHAVDVARHLILPTATLGLFYVAIYARLTRAAMLEVQTQDFVRTARAKGLPPGRITRVHILRNAILPVITMAGVQAGQLVGGAIVVETVFAWPGIGRLAFDALAQRDYNVLLGVFLTSAVMVILFNLLTDVLYRIVDPRIAGRS
ncbi:MAG: ABC transporter permease [Steroidobacteraceae bacterium]